MAERIILSLCSLLCAGLFFLMGYLCRISSNPVPFWTGSGEKLKKTVTDVPGYNRKMGEAYRRYAALWCLCAGIGAVRPMAGIVGIGLTCPFGLFLLYRCYRKALAECG